MQRLCATRYSQLAVAGAQTGVGAKEHVLQGVLRILTSGKHLPRVREQPPSVPVVDRPERLVLAGPEHRDELLVGPQSQKRRPDTGSGGG